MPERMSEERESNAIGILIETDLDDISQELIRARASESALLEQVARLEKLRDNVYYLAKREMHGKKTFPVSIQHMARLCENEGAKHSILREAPPCPDLK